jgi:hypothetical protein
MNKKQILAMEEERLLDLVQEKFNVRIKNLQDTESLYCLEHSREIRKKRLDN